jgi:hypothetical protein
MVEWKLPESTMIDGRAVRYGMIGTGPSVVAVHGTPWSSFKDGESEPILSIAHAEIKT